MRKESLVYAKSTLNLENQHIRLLSVEDSQGHLVVGSGVLIGAGRSGVISADNGLVVLIRSIGRGNSAASVGSVVARTIVMVTRSKTARGGWDGADLRVAETLGAAVALPELDAGTLGVAVGWAGTKALLLLVVAAKAKLENSRDEEQECAGYGNGKAGSVKSACGAKRGRVGDLVALTVAAEALLGVRWAIAERSADIASAAVSTITGEHSDGDHGTAAEEVEDNGEESEEGLVPGQFVPRRGHVRFLPFHRGSMSTKRQRWCIVQLHQQYQ